MSQLPSPIRDTLEPWDDEVAAQRMWNGIDQRRIERRRAVHASAHTWIRISSVAVAAIALFAMWRADRHETRMTEPGPLRLADGTALHRFTLPGAAFGAEVLRFDDGSSVTLSPGAALEPLENSGRSVALLLENGRASFEVHPGRPRHWSIDCGAASVDVIGTGFVIDRAGSHVAVHVAHGTVLVRSERLALHVRRLTDGDDLEIGGEDTTPAIAENSVADAGVEPQAAGPHAVERNRSTPSADAPPSPAPAAWRELARQGQYSQAYGTLGATGIAEQVARATPQDLLALADVARLSGHPRDAITPLETILNQYSQDPSAPLAAFTLGRVRIDALGQTREAADAFARAIDLGLPAGLLEAAYVRLVEARARSGDRAAARQAAEEYAQHVPEQHRMAEIRRWIEAE